MTFVGNDIIATQDKNNIASFTNPRYLKKVFSQREIDFITNSENDFLAYLIWTCKESAYKALVKKGLKKTFCPVNFSVFMNAAQFHKNRFVAKAMKRRRQNRYFGKVRYENHIVATLSVQTHELVHTTALTGFSKKEVTCAVKKIEMHEIENESQLSKAFLVENLAKNLSVKKSDIKIAKDAFTGSPSVQVSKKSEQIDISTSHDAGFIYQSRWNQN